MYIHMCMYNIYIYIYICATATVFLVRSFASLFNIPAYTRLVSNSAPTWSSRCGFTACHF